jgi:uncharacterized protein (UPF0333 family)
VKEMFIYLNKKGQSTLEYAILIGIIAAALVTTQVIVKRHYQGKLRESAESMGQQFSPGYTTSDYTTSSYTVSKESTLKGTSATEITEQTSDKNGWEKVADNNSEYWPK